jgi:radical SAM superfamily enzyme YgiQ (UPF0313 family)
VPEAPGDILLIASYELGHQPLSLAWPVAALSQAGFQARAIDSSVQELPAEAIASARLVGLATPMHTALRLAEPVARRVRAVNPAAHITMFGLYAWLNAEHLFASGIADSVIGAEYETALVNLARSLTHGSGPAEGVRYPDRFAPPSLARQAWAIPDRSQLPELARYAGLQRGSDVVPAGYVEATRGCKHLCSHCPITPVYNGRFFAVPREIVLADIRQQVRAGARHITFGDPDFLNGPTHSLRIVRQMHAEFPELTFDATIKVEHILQHAELFPQLHDLGCAFVVSAFESLSDRVLARLRKGHTAADIGRALDVMAEACIPVRPSLLPFTPWSTLDDFLELLDFVAERSMIGAVDPVQYSIRLLVPPGSALLDDPDAHTWLGELDGAAYTYRWRHPDARMDELHSAITNIVRRGEAEGQPATSVFAAIEAAAYSAAGLEPPTRRELAALAGSPRLTEPWFC